MGCSDSVAYVQKVRAAKLKRLMMLLTCVESSLGSRKKGMALSVLHPYVHLLTAADGNHSRLNYPCISVRYTRFFWVLSDFFHWDFRSPWICFDAQRR